MVRIRRFGIVRTATVVAVLYAIVIAIAFALFALLVLAGASGDTPQFAAGAVGVLVIGVFAALLYAAIGWVFTALACALYNVVAGWVGGIEMEIEQVAVPPLPTWGATGGGPPTWGPPRQPPGGGSESPPAPWSPPS